MQCPLIAQCSHDTATGLNNFSNTVIGVRAFVALPNSLNKLAVRLVDWIDRRQTERGDERADKLVPGKSTPSPKAPPKTAKPIPMPLATKDRINAWRSASGLCRV